MQADEESFEISSGNIKSVDIIENYKGTGRQLVIVKASLEETLVGRSYSTRDSKRYDDSYPNVTDINSTESLYGSKATLTFKSWYSYDEAKNRGITNLRNTAAYEADEDVLGNIPMWSGEKDAPTGERHKESLTEVEEYLRSAMTNLDSKNDNPNFVYAGDTYRISETDFDALSSLKKYVQKNGDTDWVDGLDNSVYVYEGGKYNYKIVLTSATDTTTKDIILIDSIEYYTPMEILTPGDSGFSVGQIVSKRELDHKNELLANDGRTPATAKEVWYWKGYFRGINVSEIEAMGVDVKVYYSTVKDLDITHEAYNPNHTTEAVPEKLADTSVWSTTMPSDPSLVTAVALDCRKAKDGSDFELHSQEALIFYLNMQAPTYEQQPDAYGVEGYNDPMNNGWAYNNVYMDITQLDDDGLAPDTHSYDHYDYTKVGIWALDVEVKKEWDDEDNNDRVRPDSVEVELVREGVPTGRKVTLSEDNDWTDIFPHVLMFDEDGMKISYSLNEVPIEGYTSTLKYDSQNMTLVNKHEPELINIPFVKEWASEEPAGWEVNIPSSITVKLYADGEYTGKQMTVRPDEEGEWYGIFQDLRKYDQGREIVYTIEENVPKDFIATIDQENMVIVNVYYPRGDLYVEKNVLNATDKALENSFTYTLTLKDEDGESIPNKFDYDILDRDGVVKSSGKIGNGGTFTLMDGEKIHVKEIYSGVRYEVKEDPKAGFTITESIATSGTISSDKVKEAVFKNTYNSRGSISFDASKTLTGRDIEKYQFRFEIKDETGTTIRLASNKEDGSVTFGALNFTEADDGKEFTYTIIETDRGKPGYTYDNTVYTAKVTPVDNGDGTMTVTSVFSKDGETVTELPFENEYHAEGDLEFKAWKVLEKRALKDQEFTFEIKDQDGHVVGTAKNNADGTITFPKLHFDENDIGKEYDFVISEVKGGDATVRYSTDAYNYHVVVSDNGDGTLSFAQDVTSLALKWKRFIVGVDSADAVKRFISEHPVEDIGMVGVDSPSEGFRYDYVATQFWIITPNSYNVGNISPLVSGVANELANMSDSWLIDEVLYIPDGDSGLSYMENYREYCAGKLREWLLMNASFSDTFEDVPSEASAMGVKHYLANTESFNYDGILQNEAHIWNVVIVGNDDTDTFIDKIMSGSYTAWGNINSEKPWVGLYVSYREQGEDSIPVFTNTLKDGSLSVEKHVSNPEEADPEQTFKFRVEFFGDDVQGMDFDGTVSAAPRQEEPIIEPGPGGSQQELLTTKLKIDKNVLEQNIRRNIWDDILDWFEDTFSIAEVYAEEGDIASGNYDGVDWRITSDGELILGKEGETQAFAYKQQRVGTNYPWNPYKDQITSVSVSGTVKGNGCMNYMFSLRAAETINLAGFDTSNVTGMFCMFSCPNVQTISLGSNFDTSNVKDMDNMFLSCKKLKSLDFGDKFDTSSATEMNGMFYECESLTSLELGDKFDTSNVTNMDGMFRGCKSLESLNLGNKFDTGNVTNMEDMFRNCESLASLDLGDKFNTSNVTKMGYMFTSCKSLVSLDLGNKFDTSSVTDMYLMFNNCENLESLSLGDKFDTSNITNMFSLFSQCKSLTSLDLGDKFDTSNVTSMNSMFQGCSSLTSLSLGDKFDTGNVKYMSSMFSNCSSLTSLDLGDKFDTSSATSISTMFNGCSSLISLDLGDKFDTSSATSIDSMFNGCSSLISLDLGDRFDTSSVTLMSGLFKGCDSLVSLDLGDKFDTSNVTSMFNMFCNCESLTALNLGDKFDTSNVTDMDSMFNGCKSLTSLDLGDKFNTSNVTHMQNTFKDCEALNRIYLPSGISIWKSASRLPSITTKPYSGKWVKEDDNGTIGAKTPTELQGQFPDNADEWAGWWMAEVSPIAVYDSTDGSLKFYNAETAKTFVPTDTQEVYPLKLEGYPAEASVPWVDVRDKIKSIEVVDEGIKPISTGYWFYNFFNLTSVDLSKLDTSETKYMAYMFHRCSNLKSLVLNEFDTSNVVSMNQMFSMCSKLETLSLGPKFVTDNVTNANNMLYGLNKLQKVTLGTEFNFKPNGTSITLPTPPVSSTTGKWMREDGTIGGKTPGELANEYNSSYAGTWVWEPKPTEYSVKFNGGDAVGSMADTTAIIDEDFTIPENKFSKLGNKFIGWATTSNATEPVYTDTIPSNTYAADVTVTLYPVWEPIQGFTKVADGVYEFELQDGMKMTIPNIPAGTTYKVYEETPDGWVLISQSGENGTIQPLETAEAIFTNKYQPGTTSVQFTGTKMLDGEPASGYKFVLKEGNTTIQTVTSSNGMIQFDPITYTSAGTHNYTITEVVEDAEGIIYDEHTERIKVVVTDNGDGTMSKEVAYDNDGIVFSNETKPENKAGSLKINKVVQGKTDANKNDTFTFSIALYEKNGIPYTSDVVYTVNSRENTITPVNGVITISGIKDTDTFILKDLPVGVKYVVSETNIPEGWSFVEITGESGSIEGNTTAEASITNEYSARGHIVLEAHKKLEGGVPNEGEFTFELLKDGVVIDTKTNGQVDRDREIAGDDENMSNPWYMTSPVTFERLSFTMADIGTHTYTIREKRGTDDKIIYDTHRETVTVTVSDAGEGYLNVVANYDSDGALFTNTMKKGSLSITKEITGDVTDVSSDAEFRFTITLKDSSGNELTSTYPYDLAAFEEEPIMATRINEDNEEELYDTGETQMVIKHLEGSIKSGGSIALKAGEVITINELPDGATYVIEEAELPGWTLVSADNASETIVAGETMHAEFTNVYAATGTVTFAARKEVIGLELIPDTYKFIVTDVNGNEIDFAYADENGLVQFRGIDYDLTDVGNVYTYYIKEVPGDEKNVAYDPSIKEVTVKVTDNGNGTLKCDVAYDKAGLTFVNRKSYEIDVKKTVIGENADSNKPFNFVLELYGDNIGEISIVKIEDGVETDYGTASTFPYEFTLTGKDSVTFSGIPERVRYVVREVEDPYYTANEDMFAGHISGDVSAEFVNDINWFTVPFEKVSKEGKLISGAKLALYQDGTLVEEWVTNGIKEVTLLPGNYVLKETQVSNPDMYLKANDINFTVNLDGTVTYDEKTLNKVTMIDDYVKTEVKVKKTWVDDNNRDGIRPNAIEVTLLGNSIEVEKVTLGPDNWEHTFGNLDKYRNGNLIYYTVVEEEVSPYTFKLTGDMEEGFEITNTYTPEKIEIKGTKTWDDNDNQDGIRPDEITVILFANGTKLKETVATKDDDYAFSFKDLWVKENGQDIEYTIKEKDVTGYTGTITDFDIVNVHKPEETSLTVSKAWDDDDNRDGIRPKTVTINLFADGKKIDSVTLGTDGWTHTFENLPKYNKGEVIEYSVTEDAVSKYETSYEEFSGTVIVTNAHTPERINLEGEKIWEDNNNQDGIRPNSITVSLYANGNKVKEVTANKDNDYKFSFDNLLKYENGKEIKYTVDENDITGYEKEINGLTITNTHTPEVIEIHGMKTWSDKDNQDGKRPSEITIRVMNGSKEVAHKTVSESDNWEWTFTDLPKYENGTEIQYVIREDDVTDYSVSYDRYDVTNAYTPGETSVTVTKAWVDKDNQDGIRPDSVTAILKADGKKIDEAVLNEGNGWEYTWEGLPEMNKGKTIKYTVDEESVPGYEKSINGTVITNTHEVEKIEIPFTKVWEDDNNRDGIRPSEITVNLLANGSVVRTLTVSEGGTFKDLDKYANGKEIVYEIEEIAVTGYDTEIAGDVKGFTITNTHEVLKKEIKGVKVWDDNENQDGIRPLNIEVVLYKNGEEFDSVMASAETYWQYEFTDLYVYENGEEIVYEIGEVQVPGYETIMNGTQITNKHVPEVIDIPVEKIWVDSDDQDGIRPDKITVNLLANGEKVESIDLAKENGYMGKFKALPKYKSGSLITYSIEEVKVSGYDVKIDGFKITNTHIPEEIEISGVKTWVDNDNQDGIRPSEVTIRLFANGEEVDSRKVRNSYKFENLPKYENGKEILYTITEDEVAGYETAIDGFNVTNTHIPEVIEISGKKVWDDADNQDGIRPETVVINLLANGEKIDSVETADKFTFTNLPKYSEGEEILYTITEDAVPNYTSSIEFDEIYVVTNSYVPGVTDVTVSKVWDDGNDEDKIRPEKVVIELLANGEVVRTGEIKAGVSSITFKELPLKANGKEILYTVKEVDVSEGYTSVITGDAKTGYTVTNSHTPIPEVEISKIDATTCEELPGAKLVVKKDGEAIYEWISGDEPHKIKLEPGTYTLTEITAPEGYEVAETITFEIDENGLVGSEKVVMEDKPVPPIVKISKVSAVETDKELPGAELIIRDMEGNIVESWISTEEIHEVRLEPGTYTLTEVRAPEGYEIAETITFKVDRNGLVDGDRVIMIDEETPIPEVEISKIDASTCEELPGAVLVITKKGTDEIVASWVSGTEPHKIKLEPGEYTLTEITAPHGYEIAESINFKVDKNGLVGSERVVMIDAPKEAPRETPVNTGDSSPLMAFAGLGLGAALILGILAVRKKRNKAE